MAYGVMRPLEFKVHQALHGYVDGHRQLALSVQLKPKDQKTLLALSDISGPGARLDDEGYLTGYPLQDSGYFALAKTWPAPEMPRPGCVWSHTLLIDFNDLATLESLSCFKEAFKRPTSAGDSQDFLEPLYLQQKPATVLPESATEWAKTILTALYGKPRHKIVATRATAEVDDIILTVWAQQWPRLRRGFRFCTLAASDRSTEGASFDLQVLPSTDRTVRSRFPDAVDAESIKSAADSWVTVALNDLTSPAASGLRSFLRKLGSDVAGGRAAFRSLCRLYRAAQAFSHSTEAIQDAITLLQQGDLSTKHGKAARSMVAHAAIKSIDTLDDSSLDFLLDNLKLLEPDVLSASAHAVGRTIWKRYPQRLDEFALEHSDSTNYLSLLSELLSDLDAANLLEGLRQAPQLVDIVLTLRPELLDEKEFWLSSDDKARQSMEMAKTLNLQAQAADALLKFERSDLAIPAVEILGPETIFEALTRNPEVRSQSLSSWVRAASHNVDTIAGFLAHRAGIPKNILHALSQALRPDAVPNSYGTDPWLTAWRNSTSNIPDYEYTFVMAHFLSRALGWRSKSQAELLQMSFEKVHLALARSRITNESWQHLDALLPWSIFWFSWDKCQRLRTGVVNAFVTRDLSPICFARLTEDENLFYSLSISAAQSSRGRKYLKQVLCEMQTDEQNFYKHIRTLQCIV